MSRGKSAIGSSTVIKGKDPCMGCRHATLCATEKLACKMMYIWIENGKIGIDKEKNPVEKYYR